MYNLISLLGSFGLLFIAWVFSRDRKKLNLRVVFWGWMLQFVVALFVFRIPAGAQVFNWANNAVVRILSFAGSGMYFVFGPLAVPPGSTGPAGEQSPGFILAFQALPAVVFFSSLMALLYHFGIMQKIVRVFTLCFTTLMRVSGAESLCAASNIMVGVESAFTIRPYLEEMTMSELCTVLTAGMATIASTVMAVYVSFLHREFPAIAGHLISASLLSAPAAIVMSKILYPEDKKPLTLGRVVETHHEKASGWIEAVIRGSHEGVTLCVGIIALLLAFLGLLEMANWFTGFLGRILNPAWDLSLQKLLAAVYYPFAFLMGVPAGDIPAVSALLGERTILTELVAYQHLNAFMQSGVIHESRSVIISTYALCGFSHIASLAIFVGGISALVPKRARDLARVGFRALCAATLACLMTGAIAGIFVTNNSTVLLKF